MCQLSSFPLPQYGMQGAVREDRGLAQLGTVISNTWPRHEVRVVRGEFYKFPDRVA